MIEKLRFDNNGLIACIAQDVHSGAVLMLAYMNEEAVKSTLESGQVHFYSRSRQQPWRKGETSGNTLSLKELRYDCDLDALLALVEPAGPACHTGEQTCFYRSVDGAVVQEFEALPKLVDTIRRRGEEKTDESYTASLLDGGVSRVGEKVTEEAAEVVEAALNESDRRVSEEAADVIYHLTVLLQARGLALEDAISVLIERME